MMHNHRFGTLVVLLVLLGCGGSSEVTVPDSTPRTPPPSPPPTVMAGPTHHRALDALAWTQTSTEYKANARQTYNVAKVMLDKALADTSWTAASEDQLSDFADKPPAIILDVDETVLDNSPYQARLLRDGGVYDIESWTAWCNEQAALPIPGAVEFTTYAASKGVKVFFVTNRMHDVEPATRANLAKHGFPLDEAMDTIYTKGEKEAWKPSDKKPRRTEIAAKYRIIMLFGDNLGDFVSKYKLTLKERDAVYEKYADYWGVRWFMLPNTLYGSWETALYGHDHAQPNDVKQTMKVKSLRY
ncbi:MAG: 5'-nucleotidase, lipoprotein e(P4) family [Myxococcota bacterium]